VNHRDYSVTEVAAYYHPQLAYPSLIPYHPHIAYPEYPFGCRLINTSEQKIAPYHAVREILHLLKLDLSNYGTDRWNPLGELINRGSRVVIKPNFVFHTNVRYGEVAIFSVITHASVLRAIVDYTYLAVGDQGKISIVDAPIVSTNFEKIPAVTMCQEIARLYKETKDFDIEILDLRPEVYICNNKGVILKKLRAVGDPLGYTTIDLGEQSELHGLSHYERMRVQNFDKGQIREHHQAGMHEYCLPNTVLAAETFINVPKLKTHKQAGVTLSLKNLIGINPRKGWLPHHTIGSPADGGDEYLERSGLKAIESRARDFFAETNPILWNMASVVGKVLLEARRIFYKAIHPKHYAEQYYDVSAGAWYGNDTIWRTILDINKILLYADKRGCLQTTQQREYLSIIDGVVGGEGRGPISPTPVRAGLLVAGTNPVAVDVIATTLMGFDYTKIKSVRNAFSAHGYPLADFTPDDIYCTSNDRCLCGSLHEIETITQFKPPPGWKGHIEKGNTKDASMDS